MKIYKRLCLNIATGERIFEDSFAYDGPVAICKGTTSTTTVSTPPATAEETRAKAISNLTNEANLNTMGYEIVDDEGVLSLRPRELTAEEQLDKNFNEQLQAQIRQRLLGGPVDPETKALVNETFNSQRELGRESITQFMREQAGARGLDLTTDTPLQREVGIATSRLETGLRGAEAASLLDSGNRQQIFSLALNEFQQGLQQQSFLNRAMIGESYAQTGLGLGRERMGNQTQTNRTSGGGGLFPSLLSGGLGAAGAIGAAFISSKDFKEDIKPISFGDEILDMIADTPINTWRYKKEFGDDKLRIGPMTEEAPSIIVNKDGKSLDPVSYMGLNLAAVKALNEKVKKLMAESHRGSV